MVADDSLWQVQVIINPLFILHCTYLARLAFPHKVGFTSAAAHLIGFLSKVNYEAIHFKPIISSHVQIY